jgi:hypothetical protein
LAAQREEQAQQTQADGALPSGALLGHFPAELVSQRDGVLAHLRGRDPRPLARGDGEEIEPGEVAELLLAQELGQEDHEHVLGVRG